MNQEIKETASNPTFRIQILAINPKKWRAQNQ